MTTQAKQIKDFIKFWNKLSPKEQRFVIHLMLKAAGVRK